jgi:glycosyltransferase involved in cell wall biosynthesis
MKLDIVLCTCDREALLRRTLESIASAKQPPGLHTNILVVDNSSRGGSVEVVRHAMSGCGFGRRLRYFRETRQGKAYALNTGIAAADGDLIGLIDDDEELHPQWLAIVYEWFQKPDVDFIGGPYVPKWTCPPPEWIPADYRGVVGWSDCGDTVREFGAKSFDLLLAGGNAVIRRAVLERCGPYSTDILRTHGRLLTGEDADMYDRLLTVGARGFYIPDLIIFHHMFPERLTKRYFRRWALWRAVSFGMLYRRRPPGEPKVFGVPRWQYRVSAFGAWKRARGWFGYPAGLAFGGELDLIQLFGLLYGRHLFWRLNKP